MGSTIKKGARNESGYALIGLVLLLSLLFMMTTGAVLGEARLRATNTKKGNEKRAIDLARGIVDEMLRMLAINGYDVETAGTIGRSDHEDNWTAQAAAQRGEDGKIVVTGTATVNNSTATVTLDLVPTGGSVLASAVLAANNSVRHTGPFGYLINSGMFYGTSPAQKAPELKLYGNVYCTTCDIVPEDFAETKWGVRPSDNSVPALSSEPFNEALSQGKFTKTSSGMVLGSLNVGEGTSYAVKGDIWLSDLHVDGFLYVQGGLYAVSLSGKGIIVVRDSVYALLEDWDGMRILAVGRSDSNGGLLLTNHDQTVPKKLFLYARQDAILGLTDSVELSSSLISAGRDVFIENYYLWGHGGVPTFTMKPGSFTWDELDTVCGSEVLPEFRGPKYEIRNWREEFSEID